MFRNILVPVDGSPPSDAAISLALQVAADESATVTFAHVLEVAKLVAMASPSSIDPSFAIDAAQTAAKEILDRAKGMASGSKVITSSVLLEGDRVSELLALAQERKVDLIVVGSHGRGGISRALLGSVAEGILRSSPIPVLVTHAPRAPEKP